MAYGSPRSEDEIVPYYTHMRGGRAPSPPALAELRRRYRAIGGGSPLQEITRRQAQGLELELSRSHGSGWKVVVGMKHSAPFIEEAVAEMAAQGYQQAVGLVMAPHYSTMSIGEYLERAKRAAANSGAELQLQFVSDWHLALGLIEWLADEVNRCLLELPEARRRDTLVIFTAHSLPSRLRELGDPYPDQLGETAEAVAQRLRLPHWTTAWQSVARTGEPWLGPELLEVVREQAGRGTRSFLVCPCGFTADHLEVLYDLDVEAQAEARRLGVEIRRTAMPNADPTFIALLASLVKAEMAPAS